MLKVYEFEKITGGPIASVVLIAASDMEQAMIICKQEFPDEEYNCKGYVKNMFADIQGLLFFS
jgi:hypothetical protein